MLDPALTLDIRQRALRESVISMRWRNLAFLHYLCDPKEVQRLLPPGLTVDTFPDSRGVEQAWIGLVPFRMEAVRPRGVPHLNAFEHFAETNVRTYCHSGGSNPGVWFFSLDAANALACVFARAQFSLNYRHARMSVERQGDRIDFQSERTSRQKHWSRVSCEIGGEMGRAVPGSLEFFLAERYLFYCYRRSQLFHAQVFHEPYLLRSVTEFTVETDLLAANGLANQSFSHAMFCEGVDVVGGPLIR